MYDYTLSIKVGDGVKSFYECEIIDRQGRKIFLERGILDNQQGVIDWVEKNLPPLYIDRLDENKINVSKVRDEMRKY